MPIPICNHAPSPQMAAVISSVPVHESALWKPLDCRVRLIPFLFSSHYEADPVSLPRRWHSALRRQSFASSLRLNHMRTPSEGHLTAEDLALFPSVYDNKIDASEIAEGTRDTWLLTTGQAGLTCFFKSETFMTANAPTLPYALAHCCTCLPYIPCDPAPSLPLPLPRHACSRQFPAIAPLSSSCL